MTTIGAYPDHMDRNEAQICNRLITSILQAGYFICVRCGEDGDVSVKTTNSRKAIQKETAATGVTVYSLMEKPTGAPYGRYIGSIVLIHGNGADLISDMSWPAASPDNEAILDRLTRPAQDFADDL